MASDYTGSDDRFFETLSLMTDSDEPSAQLFRVPLERLSDNTAWLRSLVDALFLRQANAMRLKVVTFADTNNFIAAVTVSADEDAPGPTLAIKAGQAFATYDHDNTEAYPGGAIPDLTVIRDAAVKEDGRIVVVGTPSPYCAFKDPGGVWTAGGAEIGGTPNDVVYSPSYGGFFASRATDVWRSTNAAAWTSAATGLAGVLRLAVIGGAGGAAGRVIAVSTAATPTFSMSSNDGATFASQAGTVPDAANADNGGYLSGCPMVARDGLQNYVYHLARYSSGARLRLARSADGETWEAGPTIEAPTGDAFSGTPLLLICKTTGLMVIVASAKRLTADNHDVKLVYASRDFHNWTGVSAHPGNVASTAYAIAGGRLFQTASATLFASDGIGHKVFSL